MYSGIKRKYGRVDKHILRSLLRALITHKKVHTLFTRAKALRMFAEPLITLIAKRDSLANRRKVFAQLNNDKQLGNSFINLSEQYKDRPGGYLRILKTKKRLDNSIIARVSFV